MNAARNHPEWCSRDHCTSDDKDTEHRSAPTMLATADESWEAWFSRVDEHAFPAPGGVHLELEITNLGLEMPVMRHTVEISDVPRLSAWLLAHYSAVALRGGDRP